MNINGRVSKDLILSTSGIKEFTMAKINPTENEKIANMQIKNRNSSGSCKENVMSMIYKTNQRSIPTITFMAVSKKPEVTAAEMG